MATSSDTLRGRLRDRFSGMLLSNTFDRGEITVVVESEDLFEFCQMLRDEPGFEFDQLIDVTAIDYLHYGLSEWQTATATTTGFERGVDRAAFKQAQAQAVRFEVVYHLLSTVHNHRLRIKVALGEDNLILSSVVPVWESANWFEREVYDLFGIVFNDHPDLRRILTDYGFSGYPFRKDFPISGYVEVRYDAKQERVLYEPVDIEPRTLVPKVIREDARYLEPMAEEDKDA